jgi:hypothetical protein
LFHVLLLGVTVVGVSKVGWTLPRAAALAAESPQAAPREPSAQSQDPAEPTITRGDPRTRADSGDDQGLKPRSYLLAFGGAILTGDAGRGSALGSMEEGYVRAHVLPWLGIGVSYFGLSAPNNDKRPSFSAEDRCLSDEVYTSYQTEHAIVPHSPGGPVRQ